MLPMLLPDAWKNSTLPSSLPIPLNQPSEHNLWTFTSLACSHVDAFLQLCRSEYRKLLQMWQTGLLGMWVESVRAA